MRVLRFPLLVVAAAFGWSCGGGGGPDRQVGLSPGELGIFVSDSPPDPTIRSVRIDVSRIEANLGGYPVSLPVKVNSLDLLEHVDVPAFVSSAQVSPGQYRQIKFYITRAIVED